MRGVELSASRRSLPPEKQFSVFILREQTLGFRYPEAEKSLTDTRYVKGRDDLRPEADTRVLLSGFNFVPEAAQSAGRFRDFATS